MQQADNISQLKRAQSLYVLIFIIGLIFGARLFYLQVVKYDFYRAQASESHQSKFVIPASRGRIFARDGQQSSSPLVLNQNQPTIYADPTGVEDPVAAANELSRILEMPFEDVYQQLIAPDTRYSVITKHVSIEKAETIEATELKGIGVADNPQRVYPQGALASQLLGFVSAEGNGQYGVEQALEELLNGQDGRLEAVTDVHGIPLATNDSNVDIPPVDGSDVTLTVDINIQRYVEEALKRGVKDSKSKSGSAIVMDPRSGAVLAMANFPTYDPNEFNSIEDYSLFQNDVVSAAYETGSGVKIFTMAAGLNEGVITPQTTYTDLGYKQVDDRRITNALGSGSVVRTMTEVIQNSVNTGVVEVLERLGSNGSIDEQARTTLYDYFYNKFGFGQATGIEQPNESSGVIAGPREGEGLNVRYANMAFGQGMTVTMLQMSAALSAVINGGDYMQPYLVHATSGNDGSSFINEPKILRSDIISDKTTRQIKEMMQAVINDGGGYLAQRNGYIIGGKTGTAQVIDEETGEYSDTREIGSFIGFGAGSEASYVIMVRVDEPQIPGFAGTVGASPIFADISNWLIDYYQIPPGQ